MHCTGNVNVYNEKLVEMARKKENVKQLFFSSDFSILIIFGILRKRSMVYNDRLDHWLKEEKLQVEPLRGIIQYQ